MANSRKLSTKQVYRYSKKWIQNILLELSLLHDELEDIKNRIKKLEDRVQ